MRDLDAAFAALNQQVGAAVQAPPPAEIIRRARRRTGWRAVAASIAAAAVLGGGAIFAAPADKPEPRPTPTPSVSESSPSPTPSTTPSSPPPSSPPAKAPATPQPVARDIPLGFLLYDEAAESIRWNRKDTTAGPAVCGPEVSPPGPRPTSGRRLGRPYEPGEADEGSTAEAFRIYSDDATARRALAAIQDAVSTCRRKTSNGTTVERTVQRIAIGDAALKLTEEWTEEGLRDYTNTIIFVRRGTAIAEYKALTARTAEVDARRMVKRMCRYDSGCRPADGFPNPVVPKHGKEYWVAVLAVAPSPVTDMAIGKAIAQASEVGYSVRAGDPRCDEGAAEAMKLKAEKDYEYVPVYLASDEEVQQFMDRYEPPVLFRIKVKAMCRD